MFIASLQVQELVEFLEIVEPIKHDLFARLFDLAGEEDLVEDGVDLVSAHVQPLQKLTL